MLIPVSVPYRGATFLNGRMNSKHCHQRLFPSPIGELHFSICQFLRLIHLQEFPSPIGELHFSILESECIRVELEFPSPIGELHFSMVDGLDVQKFIDTFPSPIGELHFSIPSPQPHVLSGTNRGIAGEK